MKNILIFLAGLLFISGCNKKDKDYLFTIKTKFGDMKMVLYDQTPIHKKNFIKLTKQGFYDSLIFHRVINKFMIQSGDPDSKEALAGQKLGNGGPGYTLPSEFIRGIIHEKGAVAAARQGDNINPERESSGSQFYIVQGKRWTEEELRKSRIDYNELYKYFGNLIERSSFRHVKDEVQKLQNEQKVEDLQDLIISMKDTVEMEYDVELDLPLTPKQIETYTTIGGTPHLDGTYTVFGKVIDGLEVIDKIATVPTGSDDRPEENIFLTVEMEEVDRDWIRETYNFSYPDIRSN